MPEHDVEAMLAELKPAPLSAEADAAILNAIRETRVDYTAHRRGVPAWAAIAACLVASVVSWIAGVRSVDQKAALVPAHPSGVHIISHTDFRPLTQRVHVESDVFVESPSREFDISNWAPVTGHTENRS